MALIPVHFGEPIRPKSAAPSRSGRIILRTTLRHACRQLASILAYQPIPVLDRLRTGPRHTREQSDPRLSPDLVQTIATSGNGIRKRQGSRSRVVASL